MITFEKLQLVKVMITRLDDYQIIPISQNIIIAIDLGKQQKLDVDTKAIQKINFTGNLDKAEGTTMFFTVEEVKKFLYFSKITVKVP